jgi:hypothetical protein
MAAIVGTLSKDGRGPACVRIIRTGTLLFWFTKGCVVYRRCLPDMRNALS